MLEPKNAENPGDDVASSAEPTSAERGFLVIGFFGLWFVGVGITDRIGDRVGISHFL